MFRNQGSSRSSRQNRLLAGYLALIGGFVNATGFVLIGTFTSHVTGNVGRFGNDLATRDFAAAGGALSMIAAFFAGAFVTSMMIESDVFGKTQNAYGVALTSEAALLAAFLVVSRTATLAHPRSKDLEAAILCASMGMQNGLVTRLSGAVVRTTHLTGVFTDLGIEGARWFRFWRGSLSTMSGMRLSLGRNAPERPAAEKLTLLATIAGAFILGAVLGAALGAGVRELALAVPIVLLVGGAIYAFRTDPRTGSLYPEPGSRK